MGKNTTELSIVEIKGFLSNFKFTYIQSNNIDLPSLIATYFTDEILPGLDRLRRRQTELLTSLNEFMLKSKQLERYLVINHMKQSKIKPLVHQ